MTTTISCIYELRHAQFILQQKLWDRNIEDVLRLALGKPLDGHGDARKSVVSSKLRNVFRLFFREWFAVGPDIQFVDRNAMFNASGFRRATFGEGRGFARISCRRTWCRAIKALKDAGIIDAYQEPNQGDWWVRFNSDVVADFHEQLMEIRKSFRRKRGATPCDNKVTLSSFLRASDSGSPSTSAAHSADCCEDEAKKNGIAVPAIAVSIQEDKASAARDAVMAGPNGVSVPDNSIREQDEEPDFFSLNPSPGRSSCGKVRLDESKTRESIAYLEARELVLEGTTGKVVKVLSEAYELNHLPVADLLKIKRSVSMPKHSIYRLDEAMARELCIAVQWCPEVLKAQNDAGEMLDFSKTTDFMDLLPYWRPLAKVLRQMLLSRHDDRMFDAQFEMANWNTNLLGKRPHDLPLYPDETTDPAKGATRLFANALKENKTPEEIASLASAARNYLLNSPIACYTLHTRFPQVLQLCQIPEQVHEEIITLQQMHSEIQLWEQTKEVYGFKQNDFAPKYPSNYV